MAWFSASQCWARGGVKSLLSGRSIPAEELERALDDWCQPPPRTASNKHTTKHAKAFKNIANLLSQFEDPMKKTEWAVRPRIYTILRNIGRLDTMPDFIAHKALDDMLPFPEHELPQSLGDSRRSFVQTQQYCLTDAKELERGTAGKHVQFNSSADGHFIKIKELGGGNFGRVDKVWSVLSRRQYARKKFFRSWGMQQSQRRYDWFVREIEALKRLSHRHLVKIKGSYTDPSCFAFLMESVAPFNLYQWLVRSGPDQLPTLRTFFGCLANAVVYLHKEKVYHMDIKLENILVGSSQQVFLADFGAAHDWSQREGSTTWAAIPRTVKYMPPELAWDANAPKRYSVDIWSLGVVFLEMVTVIRGAKLEEFEDLLVHAGNRSRYVYSNPVATNQWLEKLRAREAPQYDNSPLMWVKDMLATEAKNRPYAQQIRGQIMQVQGFCGFCCALSDEEMCPGAWDEHDDSEGSVVDFEDAEESFVVFDMDETAKFEAVQNPTIQSWIDRIELRGMKAPVLLQSDTNTDFLFDVVDDDDNPEGLPYDDSPTFTQQNIPNRLSKASFFGQVHDYEDSDHGRPASNIETFPFDVLSDGSDDSQSEGDLTQVEESQRSEATSIQRRLDSLDQNDVFSGLTYDDLIKLETVDECPDEDEQSCLLLERRVTDQDIAITENSQKGALETGRPADAQTSTPLHRNLDALYPGLVENKPPLDGQNGGCVSDKAPGAQATTASQEQVKSSKSWRRRLATPSDNSCCGPVGIVVQIPPSEEHRAQTEKIRSAQKVDLNQVDGTVPTPEIPCSTIEPLSESTKALSVVQDDDDSRRQRIPHNEKRSVSRRSKPPKPRPDGASTRLTAKNLRQLTTDVDIPTKRKTMLRRRVAAKLYMRQVCAKEAAQARSPGVATTAMSKRTKDQVGGLRLSVWASHHAPILENYVKRGGVAAQVPNLGPLYAAVKGASLRHNKCADALLKAGANVDVKTARSGRTMLSLAIETPSFPGYRGLIWTLLHHGANPNIKDRNGDCPILQLLYGGYKPLEEHRRAALALVLEESKYAVDVNVEPPGTRNSPLHLAVRRSDPWAAGMLLAKEASLTTKNGTGHTPFASAVNAWTKNMVPDQKEVTMLLLRHGVNPNEEILEGAPASKTTALHVAIRHAHLDLVEYLVRYGANPSRVDAEGRDAYAYCASRQNNGLLEATLADDIKSILMLPRASWESDDSENDGILEGQL